MPSRKYLKKTVKYYKSARRTYTKYVNISTTLPTGSLSIKSLPTTFEFYSYLTYLSSRELMVEYRFFRSLIM